MSFSQKTKQYDLGHVSEVFFLVLQNTKTVNQWGTKWLWQNEKNYYISKISKIWMYSSSRMWMWLWECENLSRKKKNVTKQWLYRLSILKLKMLNPNAPKSKTLSLDMMSKVENSISDLMGWITIKTHRHTEKKYCIIWSSGSVYKMCMKP